MSGWRERGVARRAFGPACEPSRCEPAGSKTRIASQNRNRAPTGQHESFSRLGAISRRGAVIWRDAAIVGAASQRAGADQRTRVELRTRLLLRTRVTLRE